MSDERPDGKLFYAIVRAHPTAKSAKDLDSGTVAAIKRFATLIDLQGFLEMDWALQRKNLELVFQDSLDLTDDELEGYVDRIINGEDEPIAGSRVWQEHGKTLLTALDEADAPVTTRFVALSLLMWANRKTGHAWPAVNTLAEQTGLNRRSVQRALRWLEDEKFIRQTRPPQHGGRYETRAYVFTKKGGRQ